MRNSDEQPEFYVDRSLGQRIVPERLRTLGLTVHTEAQVFGTEGDAPTDAAWLRRAGLEDWVVLSKDARIRYRRHELDALVRHSVRAFVLVSGQLTGVEQADAFERNLHRILRACRRSGPFVYGVHSKRIERIWPTHREAWRSFAEP